MFGTLWKCESGIEEINEKSQIKWINCYGLGILNTTKLAKKALKILDVEDFDSLIEEARRRTKCFAESNCLSIQNLIQIITQDQT